MNTQRPPLSPEEEDLKTARRFFYAGFFCLPLLWLLSSVFHWSKLKSVNVHPDLKFYVYGSAIGAAVYIAALFAWVLYFQLNVATLESLQRLLIVSVTFDDGW
mmetsp:Transcript_12376/g.24071  ORF Transcript_12376/g.24071 Transcript_12376/m.24071 type:complete len:103 (-) Transcript_12376:230-538(-)